MTNVFIFHGTRGYPEENWFPWIKTELEKVGCRVFVPQFPTPEGQSLESWLQVFEEYKTFVDKDTIFISHSLGGIFLLRLLEMLDKKVKAAFFVATPIGILPIKNWERDLAFSGSFDFDWGKIRETSQNFTVFHSDDDPYVDLGNGEALAKQLGVQLTFVPNAGHFNANAGYLEFPQLLDKVLPVISEMKALL